MASVMFSYKTRDERIAIIASAEQMGMSIIHDNHVYVKSLSVDGDVSLFDHGELTLDVIPSPPPTPAEIRYAALLTIKTALIAKPRSNWQSSDYENAAYLALLGI